MSMGDLDLLRDLHQDLVRAQAALLGGELAARRLGCDWLAEECDRCRTGDESGTLRVVVHAIDECLEERRT